LHADCFSPTQSFVRDSFELPANLEPVKHADTRAPRYSTEAHLRGRLAQLQTRTTRQEIRQI
jgi:hypothetical protein